MLENIKKWAGFALETVFIFPVSLYKSVKFEMALQKLAKAHAAAQSKADITPQDLEVYPFDRCTRCGRERPLPVCEGQQVTCGCGTVWEAVKNIGGLTWKQ